MKTRLYSTFIFAFICFSHFNKCYTFALYRYVYVVLNQI